MGIELDFEVDMDALLVYYDSMANPTSPHHQGLMIMWSVRYRTAMIRRWNQYAGGGGDWPPLRPATIRRRRNKKKGSIRILVDTGILRDALTPVATLHKGKPGAYTKLIPGGVRVGFGGPDRHREAGASIARMAYWHHMGSGNLPERKLMVSPDKELQDKMRGDVERVFARIKRDEGMTG